MPRRRRDLHLVTGDVLNPPARGAQRKDVADAGFIHHLFVELTHAPGRAAFRATHQEDAEHAAVGNGAAAGHGHALRTRARRQHARDPVIDDAGLELREIRRGIHARGQVDDGVEDLTCQVPVRPGAADSLVPLVHVEAVLARRSDSRDGLLRKDVERVARGFQLLDKAFAHAPHRHRGLQQVRPMLRVKRACRYRPYRMPRTAHTLQARGHRWR